MYLISTKLPTVSTMLPTVSGMLPPRQRARHSKIPPLRQDPDYLDKTPTT